MPLIDPQTPEGFFHMRLAPLNQSMLNNDVSFFATQPDVENSSYFNEAGAADRHGIEKRCCGLAPIRAQEVVGELLRLWQTQEHYAEILGPVQSALTALQASIIAEREAPTDRGAEEVSDYIYPIS